MRYVFLSVGLSLLVVGGVGVDPATTSVVLFISGVLIGTALSFHWATLEQQDFVRRLQQDEAKFALVLREFYQQDPVLTNGLWKKIHPNIVPPWHQDAARKET